MRCALSWTDYLSYGTLQAGKTSPTSSRTYSIGSLALGDSDDKTSEQVEILKALLRTKHTAIRPCDWHYLCILNLSQYYDGYECPDRHG